MEYVLAIWLSIQIGTLVLGFGMLGMTLEENKKTLETYSKPVQLIVYTVPWLINKIWG